MNTFRRNDLLRQSALHYMTCECVKEIQVIWSDQINKPLNDLFGRNGGEANTEKRIQYELHDKDSLNNRFLSKLQITTQVT